MSILVKAIPAPKPRTKESRKVALILAVIFVIFAVAQLFSFEDFIKLIPMFNLPLGQGMTYALAPTLVAAEVFALPFLLMMPLSVGFRWFGVLCNWLVAALWLFMSSWVVFTEPRVSTVGYLGTVVHIEPGLWAVFVALAITILVAWASWGLWPGKRAKK